MQGVSFRPKPVLALDRCQYLPIFGANSFLAT
jgi:hypothetical protein